VLPFVGSLCENDVARGWITPLVRPRLGARHTSRRGELPNSRRYSCPSWDGSRPPPVTPTRPRPAHPSI